MEMGKQNSGTFPGLFSFFKDSIFLSILYKQHKKCTFFSRKRQSGKRHMLCLILIQVIKPGTAAQNE